MSKLKEVLDEIIKKGYTIDNFGIVKNPKGKVIKGSVYDNYIKFSAKTSISKSFPVRIHRFQAYIKFGDEIFKEGVVVRHLDGNSLNNEWDNIAIGTQSDNMMDRPEIERKNHNKSKTSLTEENKIAINKWIAEPESKEKESARKLAKSLGVARSTLNDYIKKNKNQ
jgi:hypothetical protein